MANVVPISTLSDPRIAVFHDVRDADLRGRHHLCMVESEMAVRRLLESDWEIHSLFVSPQKYERLSSLLEHRDIDVFIADIALMSEVTGFHIHRGVLAAVRRQSQAHHTIDTIFKGGDHVSLLLAEGITNVDNMGTLFRNAAAFGVDGVLLNVICCDPLYRKSIRVSMGHVFSVPWFVLEDWTASLRALRDEFDLQIIGLETGSAAIPLWDVDVQRNIGVVVGEEKSGLSASTLTLCDVVAEIPMMDSVPSINVGVASAVGLYDLVLRNRLDSR